MAASSPASSRDVEAYDMLVDDLDLPTYVHSVLSRAGIERSATCSVTRTKELMDIPGLGQKSLEEVRARLADKGWALAGDEAHAEAGEDGRGPPR